MHNRITAFFISSSQNDTPSYRKSADHLQKLAESFSKKTAIVELEKYCLHLVYEGKLEKLLIKENGGIKFCVGPHRSRKNSGWDFSMEKRRKIRDIFLLVCIDGGEITVTNDLGGILPVYYSLRKNLCLSNIEPVIVLNTDSSYDDLSHETVYELLRYTHLHGMKTLYRHIRTQEPDSTYIYKGSNAPVVEYNNTISLREDLNNRKEADIIAELKDFNQTLVHETLSSEDDIILPLSSGYDSRMILAAAAEDKDIKSKLRSFTYAPNMSLETRPAQELCKITGVNWKKIQLPTESFSIPRLEQILRIFGSTLHTHGKYQLDFIDQIKDTFYPGKSVLASGFMTGMIVKHSFMSKFNPCKSNMPLAEALSMTPISNYLPDDYIAVHSSLLHSEMKYQMEPEICKMFDRNCGEDNFRLSMLNIWTRQRNFGAYLPIVLGWEIPSTAPLFTPEFINFTLAMSSRLQTNKKNLELLFSKHYPSLYGVASNSNLTATNILKRSITRPSDGMRQYLPLLIKYYFKQPALLPEKLISEMKDPVLPNLRCIGKAGLYPLFDLNTESREIFDRYFALTEVENLFSKAMNGDNLSCKRLTVLQALAYALKMLEK